MKAFPEFMKQPANRIGKESQYTEGIEGYVFNGVDGSQMAYWTCYQNRDSKEHTHDFDEYFVVVQGEYTVILDGKEEPLRTGQECYIPKGTPHAGRAVAGTRTIHCFGGKRVEQNTGQTKPHKVHSMLTTKEAIERRRSIRKFKSDPIPDAHINELLQAARLAPSGCNAQPWRFKIVKDQETRNKLAGAAFDQAFIADAPVVLVCCAEISGYINGQVSAIQDLGKIGAVEDGIAKILLKRTDQMKTLTSDQIGSQLAFNVAIAIEHIVLRALDLDLGSCWVRLLDRQKIRDIFGWNDDRYVVALLPIGYPAEFPEERKRLELKDIII